LKPGEKSVENIEETRARYARQARRIVVKVGSAVLTSEEGELDEDAIRRLSGQICHLVKQAREFVIVSSGAIAAGKNKLGRKNIPKTIPYKQASAALGQSYLIWAYEKNFKRRGLNVAQVRRTHE